LPVSFIAGKMMLVRGLVSGANVVVEEPVVSPMLAHPGLISFSAMTPAQVHKVLSDDQGRLNNVKNLIIGGAPVGMDLEDQLQHIETNCYSTFGMTETATHVALMRLNGTNKSDVFRAVGDVTFGMDDRMCLMINSESLDLVNLITNDIVQIVDSSSFRWMGRQDHVINTGGIKVFPEQIEKKMGPILNGNFFFAAMSDDQFGEIVILLVEGKERRLDLAVLSKFEQPNRVYFVERFSFTGSGKIDRKKVLKELLDA
jgi:O-succinylbenzoic acid--CoA ligase